MNLHNAHVITFYSYEAWLASRTGRLMAQTFFTHLHNLELEKSA